MKNLLLSYAVDLNDAYPGHEFSVWTESQLLNYFNDALCIIAANRPDMFTELKVIKVEGCSTYLNTCGCINILEVLGQCDEHGNITNPLVKRDYNNTTWTGRLRRSTPLTDKLKEYEIVPDSSLLRVFPENLDPSKDIYVLVRCSVGSGSYDINDAAPGERCAFIAAARHWVLYNAKMMDAEFSNGMYTAAIEHRKMFTSILGLVEDADEKYREPADEGKK